MMMQMMLYLNQLYQYLNIIDILEKSNKFLQLANHKFIEESKSEHLSPKCSIPHLLPSVQPLPLLPPSVLSPELLVLHPPGQHEVSRPQEDPDQTQAQQ